MYNGNTNEISKELESYYDKFGESFPLMQANGSAKIVKNQIKECLRNNKKANEIWPDIYGKCEDKNI